MAKEIVMPKLSDTMTEGRLVSWKKGVGERVERGDIIAEVETDKANMELEAFHSGILTEIRARQGDMAPVGKVIALIGEEGEEASPEEGKEEAEEKFHGVEERVSSLAGAEESTAVEEEGGEGEKASPLVRRMAREQGIDLKKVAGSGPDGRILREDIERLMQGREDAVGIQAGEKPREPAGEPPASISPHSGETRPLSRLRAAITRTVTRAWQEIPHFAVTVAIDMGEAETMRQELKESGTAVSVNDMIVKGVAMALQKYPQANNSFARDRVMINKEINIGMVVGLEDGLLVPVIRKCQEMTLKQIALRSRELIELSLGGKISEIDISGGTFTISNLGMFGVEEFMALIYPPQGAILAVGTVRDEAVVKDGSLCAGRTMRVTLSADHRLMDGAYAARFLQELKRVLENPVSLLS